MKVRIKFRKYGVLKFIGHLDVMRFFQKMMRRAEIPIAFTGGYSPHMIMSFASPLGIGLTSDGEYVDIELTELIDSETAVRRMNAVTAEGIEDLKFPADFGRKESNRDGDRCSGGLSCVGAERNDAGSMERTVYGIPFSERDPYRKTDKAERTGSGYPSVDLSGGNPRGADLSPSGSRERTESETGSCDGSVL